MVGLIPASSYRKPGKRPPAACRVFYEQAPLGETRGQTDCGLK
ncbi:hypothetical protein D554_3752 [Bordetella holmesii 30539]|uniref:Uncharacterized protein n=2 Tax=Bordetella holmesii TaxID=35814 RepID=A0A158LZ54_9BORD|nr:hypothetical protein D560_3870 [Bordetella holmesii ATCC 51541]AIT28483.1 hypothetical protein D558_3843 [Bordetella holmesii 44057]EWM41272.1 hypothetical protein D555_3917 [Bordetella holmesii 35009]EWM41855.1 hypothetical protein D556_3846 [Bordetella holmesii 41130]EXF88475.1 hypothetical protein D554_3752 [Bordetella holmesii 30539]EXX94477.1 hypothetical protein D559_1886 [Bordetella holmesii 1058]KAK66516.1 hypothetical protein L573_1091 [Bordetella holmesii H620]KAK83080.1 hypothe